MHVSQPSVSSFYFKEDNEVSFFFLLSFLLVLACYCFPPVHAVRCLPATLQCESSVELSMWHLLTSVIAWITQESAVDPTTGAKQ